MRWACDRTKSHEVFSRTNFFRVVVNKYPGGKIFEVTCSYLLTRLVLAPHAEYIRILLISRFSVEIGTLSVYRSVPETRRSDSVQMQSEFEGKR